jgi:hypothetical protein
MILVHKHTNLRNLVGLHQVSAELKKCYYVQFGSRLSLQLGARGGAVD